jgi:RNA polymerase sigma factor (sigma-70 family)
MMSAGESDEALMSRYARGDVTAFETLYRRHEMRVWRYLERNLRNRASSDELMQEVWFAVARDAVRYEPSARFTTWLFTIAHHRMIDSIRTNRRHVSLDAPEFDAKSEAARLMADPNANPVAEVISQDQATALIQAIAQLPAEQRDAFLLQVEGDLSVVEIAAITRASFETTKSRLRYARTKLREQLKEYA